MFSLLIESLPKPTGMFKVAAMEINYLTPFPDPTDLPSRPLLRWRGEGGGQSVGGRAEESKGDR